MMQTTIRALPRHLTNFPAKLVIGPRTSSSRISPLNRRFSMSPISQEASSNIETLASEGGGTEIVRHGPSDGVIVLNVGGKDYMTLRSTVASNSVLADHVARAEANQELTSKGSSVFIDRDPTHFGIVLTHLRNKVEGLTYRTHKAKYSRMQKTNKYVQLPKDTSKLRDLYVEATHYEIYELQEALCEQSLMVNIASLFSGGNPFDAASSFLKNLRRGAVALGGASSFFMVGTQPDWLPLPWTSDKEGAQPVPAAAS